MPNSIGTLAFNADGTFKYTPNNNFNGVDSFRYHTVDSDGSVSNIAAVNITIISVNDVPVATSENVTTDQNTVLNVAAPGVLGNDSDIEGTVLLTQLVTGPSHGTLTLAPDGSFVYLPDSVFTGTDSFSYRATDGQDVSNTVVVTITVRAIGTGVTPPTPTPTPTPVGPPGVDPSPVVPPVISVPPPSPPSGGVDPDPSRIPVLLSTPARSIIEAPVIITATMSDQQNSQSWRQGQYRQKQSLFADEAMPIVDVELAVVRPNAFVFQVGVLHQGDLEERPSDNQSLLSLDRLAAGTAVSVVSAFSVGYALWTLRSGYLLTSFLAALPAWQMMDPLPVLQSFAATKNDDEDDDDVDSQGHREGRSLSSLVQHRSQKAAVLVNSNSSLSAPSEDRQAT
ncbi:MAG: cadherin-like domain-containing protein [Planctomycetia bacterium]|nr:cadherin-like domain-containing protein [Planctomycetia bacterium]